MAEQTTTSFYLFSFSHYILNDVDTSNCKAMISMIKATCFFFCSVNIHHVNGIAYREQREIMGWWVRRDFQGFLDSWDCLWDLHLNYFINQLALFFCENILTNHSLLIASFTQLKQFLQSNHNVFTSWYNGMTQNIYQNVWGLVRQYCLLYFISCYMQVKCVKSSQNFTATLLKA